MKILPPPVTPSDEEPIAAGGWQTQCPEHAPGSSGMRGIFELNGREPERLGSICRQHCLHRAPQRMPNKTKNNLPPPVTPSDEEPIAAGGWYSLERRKN
ncbi:MAG: hypothetical protein WCL11_05105 [Verrucomicrobiota bacterium]